MTVCVRVHRPSLGVCKQLPGGGYYVDIQGNDYQGDRSGEVTVFFADEKSAAHFFAEVFNNLSQDGQQHFIDKVIDANVESQEPLADWERELLNGNVVILHH